MPSTHNSLQGSVLTTDASEVAISAVHISLTTKWLIIRSPTKAAIFPPRVGVSALLLELLAVVPPYGWFHAETASIGTVHLDPWRQIGLRTDSQAVM